MALLAEHLVGRADELGSLEPLLDELDRGHPGAIELAGEPGIGKTRLLRHDRPSRRPRRAMSTLQLRLKIC